MNKIFRYVMGLMMAMLLTLPVQAQTDDDEVEVADSTMMDSLVTDTLKLPWPESVQVGINKLLESKMFETSQVVIILYLQLSRATVDAPSQYDETHDCHYCTG